MEGIGSFTLNASYRAKTVIQIMANPLPQISIIIPVFNQWEFTEPCLQALARTIPERKDGLKHQIVIVDNGSTDRTQSQLRSVSGGQWANASLSYIRFDTNRGFNAASNSGAEASRGEVLVFLNNDTIPQTGWLEALWNALQLPNVGIVGPKLLFPDTQGINHIGYSYNPALGGYFPLYFNKPATFPPACKPREFQALLGACMMIRKADFMSVGMFSLDGLEDIDLCLKVRAAGKRVLYTPRAEVWHHGGATFRNTKGELIPKMTNEAFNVRWPSSTLERDDEKFYREDGYGCEIGADRVITLFADHEIARERFKTAEAAWAAGNREEAIALGRKSLELYQRNIPVLKQVALWLVEVGRPTEAAPLRELLEFLGGLR